jgi:spore photoproduct lyase
VEEGVENYRLTQRILERMPRTPFKTVPEYHHPLKADIGNPEKRTLHLIKHKGEFLKPCPGTKKYICCGYQILNVATNCPLNCSYCILQTYFNQPFIRIFANLEEEMGRILQRIDSEPKKIFRLGTGEFTDSLAVDPVTGWSELLLSEFSKRKNAVLELKTKTTEIQNLISSRYRERTVISWSLNSPYVAAHEEHGAAGLLQRIKAAKRCQSEGFVVGFHFDPIIQHKGWAEEYRKTIDLLDKHIDPAGIIWISMGSFRYMPQLKPVIRTRHPMSRVLDGEFVPGLDGKMRYFKPLRIDLYGHIREYLSQWFRGAGVYLCMESDEIWRKALGWSPLNSEGLCRYLDDRVLEVFGGFRQ